MGLVDEFERRLEKVVEGAFSKAFKSKVQPSEIGRRLLREMEGGKSVSVGAVYVPNSYTVSLAPKDHERFAGLIPTLTKEFADLLRANAKERRWKLPGGIDVGFEVEDTRREGTFTVAAKHATTSGGAPEERPEAPPVLRLEGPGEQEWVLHSDVTLGRASSNEIMLADANASREHARVFRRDDGWWIEDLGSTNGTVVNDALVKERRLRDGDVIRVGSTDLVFLEQDSS